MAPSRRSSPSSRPAGGRWFGPLQAALEERLGPTWQRLAPRERLGVQLAGAAVALLLVWMVAVQPALDSLASLPPRQAELDRQWQQMLALASEARELRSQPPLPPAQAEAALRAATERLGTSARLSAQGERMVVQLNEVAPATLVAWLGEVRSAARARVAEAQLRRSISPPTPAGLAPVAAALTAMTAARTPAGLTPGAPTATGSATPGFTGSVVLVLPRSAP